MTKAGSKREPKHWLLAIPPVLILLTALFRKQVEPLARKIGDLYDCPFRRVTGIHCPGCGGTRSMLALIRGDFLEALHDNPAAPLLVLIVLLFYLEAVFAAFGKHVKLFPRNVWFWCVLLGIHLVWSVVRNFVPSMLPVPI